MVKKHNYSRVAEGPVHDPLRCLGQQNAPSAVPFDFAMVRRLHPPCHFCIELKVCLGPERTRRRASPLEEAGRLVGLERAERHPHI